MNFMAWIKSLFVPSKSLAKPADDLSGWREVSEDEVLQPGQQIRMSMSTGKSYVRKASA